MKFPKFIAISVPILLIQPAVSVCRQGSAVLAAQRSQEQQDQNEDSKTPAAQPSIPAALPKGKKLVLKDGTFQLAREYSVEGDRVRYWSVERSEWDEMPASMVDWDATRNAETEAAARDADLKAKIRASDLAMRAKDIDVDRSLEIKPGLFLPDGVGFYALDANKLIFEMKQSDALSKLSMGREIGKRLSGVQMIPSKTTLAIPGERAALRLKSAEPEFYFRPADGREPRFRLLRCQVKGGRRIVENVSIRFTGQQTHNGTEIEIQSWTPATGVFRYTLDQRLEPGEYTFVEMTDQGTSGYVWDFGVDATESKSNK